MNMQTLKFIPCLIMLIFAQPIANAVTPAILNQNNAELINRLSSNIKEQDEAASNDCSNPESDGSLAQRQIDVLEKKKTIDTSPTDLNKYFEIGKSKGCFTALANFPDLSISIPSFSSIFTARQKTLTDYATRKVCNVVNEALEAAIGPISAQVEKLSSSGQLDLSGRVNKAMTKKYYEIDPEMGRVSTRVETEQKFNW